MPSVRRRRALTLAVGAVLLSSCAGSSIAAIPALPTSRPHQGGPGVPQAPEASGSVPTLAQAESLVYTNHYDQAAAAYAQIVAASPHDPLALADQALFLNYRLDYADALRQARAAVSAGPESERAYTVLCRVDDWSGDIAGAVAAGRRAVSLDSRSVLAHLFLSEALGDSGDLAGGRNEVATAKGLVAPRTPAYEQAELHREEGNLARDAGDLAGELAAFKAAFAAQPGWVERPSELASAYVDNGDLQGAHGALQQALALAPQDGGLLLSLGRIAMLEQDYSGADGAFTQLVALRPDDAQALELAAHARMAHRADLDGAVGLLVRSLTADAQSDEAAAYLLALERYVRGDPARGTAELGAAVAAHAARLRPGRGGARPPDVDGLLAAQQRHALDLVNQVRRQAGMPTVVLDAALGQSAVQHCFYWLFNNGSPSVAKLGIHSETAGLPAYSGAGPAERAEAHGWHQGPVGEDITHRGSADSAVADWVNSVYHRFPLLRPDLTAIGYAGCAVGPLPMEDMEFGLGGGVGPHHAPVPYPADGQTGVPAQFVDNEIPDPVPAGQPRTTGYPVTVTFDARAHVEVASFSVVDSSGHQLDGYRLDPGPSSENSASLLPVVPLHHGERYTARVTGTLDLAPLTLTWSFTVAS